MQDLFSLEAEQSVLAILLKSPDAYFEIGFLNSHDFSRINSPIFSILSQMIDKKEVPTPIVVTERLKSAAISLENLDVGTYLDALSWRAADRSAVLTLAKEIKRLTVRRELIERCDKAKMQLIDAHEKTAEQIVSIVDKTLSDITTKYYHSDTEDIFSSLIDVVEKRGNNPILAEQLGLMGPFESINKTLGSLVFPGSFTVIGSRSGGGKSSLGFYYNVFLAEKYDLPILHLDAAEMTIEQLQMRAVCALSHGRVPLWAVRSGEWRKSKEYVDIIRGEVWPRVKKIKIYFQNIGSFTPKEMTSFVRRFYYGKAGRDNHLLVHWDYIKGTESANKNHAEHQSIGFMINDLKTLITDEITASIWTSVQNNKSGIYTGKSSSEIRDSEESFSLSDRIIQQSTNSFLMRYKVPDELLFEDNQFGNIILKPVKERELLGRNYQEMLKPVRVPDGKSFRFMKNYFNLETTNFYYADKGSLREMVGKMGGTKIKTDEDSVRPPDIFN